MDILSIKYSNAEHDAVTVFLSDGSRLHSAYPLVTWHREFIIAFVDEIDGAGNLVNEIEDFITFEDSLEIIEAERVKAIDNETKERELLLIPGIIELRAAAEDAKTNGDSLEKFKIDAEKIKPIK